MISGIEKFSNFLKLKSHWDILGILGFGLTVLLSLAPFQIFPLGFIPFTILIVLARKYSTESILQNLLLYIYLSLSVSIFAFHWIFVGIKNLAQTGITGALFLFLLYSILSNLKILIVILSYRWIRKFIPDWEMVAASGIALGSEIFVFQFFPWYYGNLITSFDFLNRAVADFGVYGLSFYNFLISFLIIFIIEWYQTKNRTSLLKSIPIIILLLLFHISLFREMKLEGSDVPIKIAMIQPNTEIGLKEKKNDPMFTSRALTKSAKLALDAIRNSNGNLDLMIFPETAIPYYGTKKDPKNPNEVHYLKEFHGLITYLAKKGNLDLIYNEVYKIDDKIFNAVSIFQSDGKMGNSYTKKRLVPFGEYIPELFSFLRVVFPEVSEYSGGGNPLPLGFTFEKPVSHLYLSPVTESELRMIEDPDFLSNYWPHEKGKKDGIVLGALCYEAMFPELIRENSLHVLPDLIVNPVNDSWFGNTIENHQHYNASKLRAIEMGRPLIRVALSGISGAVDALGNELILPIHIGEEDFRIFELKLQKRDTLYFKYGNWTLFVLYLFFLSLDRVLNKILRK